MSKFYRFKNSGPAIYVKPTNEYVICCDADSSISSEDILKLFNIDNHKNYKIDKECIAGWIDSETEEFIERGTNKRVKIYPKYVGSYNASDIKRISEPKLLHIIEEDGSYFVVDQYNNKVSTHLNTKEEAEKFININKNFSERLMKCFDTNLVDLDKIHGESDITSEVNKPGVIINSSRSKTSVSKLKEFCELHNIKYTPSELNKGVVEV